MAGEAQVTVVFDPLADGYFDDPYQQYAALRAHDPVHRGPMGLMCFRYDDVWQMLRQPGTTMGAGNVPTADGHPRSSSSLFPRGLINLDPPDHPRVRRLMSRIFPPRRIDEMGVTIQAEVDHLLDGLEARWMDERQPIDLVSALAFPLPFKVISDILGMPATDDDQVREWAQAVSEGTLAVSRESFKQAMDAYHGISEYVAGEVLPWKREHPGEDLLSVLLAAQDEGESLTLEEVVDQVTLLYVAGHETTTGLISCAILNLLRHRAQLELLRSDPDLLPNAIEELNRYDSAIQFTWRYALEPLELGGERIEAGEIVMLSLGSANRDPSRFGADADVLDLRRATARDALSFGAGPHFCLGASLARREGMLAIQTLVKRFPGLALAGSHEWNPRVTFRALRALPVSLAG